MKSVSGTIIPRFLRSILEIEYISLIEECNSYLGEVQRA